MTARVAVVVLGRGKLGGVLAKRLRAVGVPTKLLPGRGSANEARALARATLVWIAVPDPSIADVARRIAPALPRGVSVVHASGATSLDALAACAEVGAHVGIAHPLVSFGGPATALEGTSFVLGGARAATRAVATLVRRLGARPVVRDVHGPGYHAAAALVANGAVALAAHAVKWMVREGLSEREAERAVGALLGSVAANVGRRGAARSLTGPIARGDARTVARHLSVLGPDERAVYATVAELIVPVAVEGGLSVDRVESVRRALVDA